MDFDARAQAQVGQNPGTLLSLVEMHNFTNFPQIRYSVKTKVHVAAE